MSYLMRTLALFPLLVFQAVLPAVELGEEKKPPKGPNVDEAEWLKSLKLPEGLQPSVWASGTQILNAIAIDVDEQGRVFAAETARWRLGGVIDVRNFLFLYKDDLRVETSADRAALIEKWKDKKTQEIVNFTHNQLPYVNVLFLTLVSNSPVLPGFILPTLTFLPFPGQDVLEVPVSCAEPPGFFFTRTES